MLHVQGLDEILAFSLADDLSASRWSLTKRNPFKAELFSRMMKLRYLFLDGCSLKGNFLGWSTELKWVQWRWFPHQELPRSFKLQHLAVLDLANSHSLTHLRSENFRPHLWKGPRCLSCQKVEVTTHIPKNSFFWFTNGCTKVPWMFVVTSPQCEDTFL